MSAPPLDQTQLRDEVDDERTSGGLNGVLADGGMTIFKAADREEATRIATDDRR